MDRQKFVELMENRSIPTVENDEAIQLIHWSLHACSWQEKSMKIMEELAELQKEVSKSVLEPEYHLYDLLQEMADVAICLELLQEHFDISYEMLSRAAGIKLTDYKERVENDKNNV